MHKKPVPSSGPWWKFGHVWMVLAGPALVVAASLVTFYIALTRPDPVVAEDYYRQGIEINKRTRGVLGSDTNLAKPQVHAAAPQPTGEPTAKLGSDPKKPNMAPAIQARNHAATGTLP